MNIGVEHWRDHFFAGGGLPRPLGFLPTVVGASMAVRRDVFDAVGGFDPASGTADDVTFSWAAQLAGARIAYAPSALVQYRHRNSWQLLAKQFYAYGKSQARVQRQFGPYGLKRESSWLAFAASVRDAVAQSGQQWSTGRALRCLAGAWGLAVGGWKLRRFDPLPVFESRLADVRGKTADSAREPELAFT